METALLLSSLLCQSSCGDGTGRLASLCSPQQTFLPNLDLLYKLIMKKIDIPFFKNLKLNILEVNFNL